MIQLLEKEEVRADLRRGLIQRLTNDLWQLRTIILTNQRLALIVKRLGSFEKQYIFLKDVQGIASSRSLSIGALLALCVTVPLAVVGIWAQTQSSFGAERVVISLAATIASIVLLLNLKSNVIRISTMTEDISFRLDKKLGTDSADRFVELAQKEIAHQKGAARP